jgi:hypothetical protein
VRQVDAYAGTGAVRLGLDEVDGAAVQVGDPASDGEAEAGATAALGLCERPEPLEHAIPVGGRDTGALVGDLEPPAGARLLGADPHHATGRAVPRRVVEQVGDQLVQSRRVGRGRQRRRCHAYVVAHLTAADPRLGDRAFQQVYDGDLGGRQLRLPGVHAGEVEQVGGEGADPLCLVERRSQGRGVRLGDPVDEVLQHGAQGGQRGAQLVAHVRDQLAALAVHGGQVLGHPVEGAGQLSDLVARGGGDPARVVAAGHPSGGGGHVAQGRSHPHGQQLGHTQGQSHGDREAEPERHPAGGADRGDDRGHRDAHRYQQAELHLDRRDLVQQRTAHVTTCPSGTSVLRPRTGMLRA